MNFLCELRVRELWCISVRDEHFKYSQMYLSNEGHDPGQYFPTPSAFVAISCSFSPIVPFSAAAEPHHLHPEIILKKKVFNFFFI